MKKAKKVMVVGALVLAMMIVPLGKSFPAKTDSDETEKNLTVFLHPIEIKAKSLAIPYKPETLLERNMIPMNVGIDVQITSSPNEESYPSIARCSGDNLVVVYNVKPSPIESYIEIAVSQDGGETWPEELRHIIGVEGFNEMPWVAYRGHENMAVATWRSEEYDAGNPVYFMNDITDPETWGGSIQDWSDYEFFGFHDHKIAGYYWEGQENFWGIECFIGSTDYGAEQGWDCREAPMLYLSIDPWMEGYVGIIWESEYNNSRHPTIDIDSSTGIMYSAFEKYNESTGTYDIRLWMGEVENFWGDDSVQFGAEITAGLLWSYSHPCISAENGHAYLVFQTTEKGNEDIVCVHSTDHFETYDITTIVDSSDDELYPSIVAYGESATCTFYKNGNLYVSHTNDGGATWSEPEQINDQDGTVMGIWRTAQVTTNGDVVWIDERNENADIYYDNVGVPGPILSIKSISGGFGVKATVANMGTADAENIEWSITFDGTVFIGKEKSGTVTIPAGGEATIKSGFIFGIGPATVTVNVGGATKTASCFVLGPLVLGVK